MKSLAYIPASDGSGDASLMTITQVRTAPATSITVNTVAGVPRKFFGTMGTPHTFNDPVTGETITIISEATAVNFAGHIDSGKVEIDAIAPGETDIGSKVGDIIVIRPTTQWANNLHDVLAESLNDDGSLKAKSVKAQNIDFTTFGNTAVFGSNSLSITIVAPFDAIADVSGGSNGWGYDGGIVLTNISASGGLTRVAYEQGNRQGLNTASLPMRGRAVFTGLKKGVSYTFSVTRHGAGVEGNTDQSMIAILHQIGV